MTIILIAVGDVSFAGGMTASTIEKSSKNIEKKMMIGDIIFCNLESPFTSGIKKQKCHYSKILNDSGCVFLKSDPKNSEWLKKYYFNVVSIANNHIMDYGIEGLDNTIEYLNKVNIKHIGAGKNIKEASSPFLFKKNGLMVGLLAYSYTYEAMKNNPGCAPIYQKSIIKKITELKATCDIIIISLHFGEEFSLIPNKSEIDFCHSLVNSGANVILGHHPHVIRPIENYNGGIIAYSLGNFIFDPKFHVLDKREQVDNYLRKGMILQLEINPNKSLEYSTYPVRLNDFGLPELDDEISPENAENNNETHQNKISNSPKKFTEKILDREKMIQKIKDLMGIIIFSIVMAEFKNIVLLMKRAAWKRL